MIARWRLHEADKRAWKRWVAWNGGWQRAGAMLEPWQRYRKTTKLCSCWMCGNQRRYCGERTVQERRAGWQ